MEEEMNRQAVLDVLATQATQQAIVKMQQASLEVISDGASTTSRVKGQ